MTPTAVLLGATGVGKSSLANRLLGHDLSEPTSRLPFKPVNAGKGPEELYCKTGMLLGQQELGPVQLLDTPGVNDQTGPAVDTARIAAVEEFFNNNRISVVAVVLTADNPRISSPVARLLGAILKKLSNSYQHVAFVVNQTHMDHAARTRRHRSYQVSSEADFRRKYSDMLETHLTGESIEGHLPRLTQQDLHGFGMRIFFVDALADDGAEGHAESAGDLQSLADFISKMPALDEGALAAISMPTLYPDIDDAQKGAQAAHIARLKAEEIMNQTEAAMQRRDKPEQQMAQTLAPSDVAEALHPDEQHGKARAAESATLAEQFITYLAVPALKWGAVIALGQALVLAMLSLCPHCFLPQAAHAFVATHVRPSFIFMVSALIIGATWVVCLKMKKFIDWALQSAASNTHPLDFVKMMLRKTRFS